MGQKTLIAIVFALLVSVTMIISCAGPSPVVTFPDSNLNAAIRKTDLPPWTIPV